MQKQDPLNVRLSLRDCTGKYVWEFGLTYDINGMLAVQPSNVQISQRLLPSPAAKKLQKYVICGPNNEIKSDQATQRPPDKRNVKEPPSFRTCKDLDIDPFKELLD
jgi:hypothetical protein